MRESFIFYKSFKTAMDNLNDNDKIEALDMLCDYAFDGTEPQTKSAARAVFECFKPQIDANNRRYENGLKGGRPKKAKKPKTEKEPKADEPVKKPYGENGNVLLTDEELDRLCKTYGIEDTEQAIKVLNDYIDSLAPAKKKEYLKKNHCRCMQNWCFKRVEENKGKVIDKRNGFDRGMMNRYSREDMSELEMKLLEN